MESWSRGMSTLGAAVGRVEGAAATVAAPGAKGLEPPCPGYHDAVVPRAQDRRRSAPPPFCFAKPVTSIFGSHAPPTSTTPSTTTPPCFALLAVEPADVMEKSRNKSVALGDLASRMDRVERLEAELRKVKQHARHLELKRDADAADYRNALQDLTESRDAKSCEIKALEAEKAILLEKNTQLRRKNTELKVDNEKLQSDAESWAVAFYRKQDEAEKLADSLQRIQDLGPQLVSAQEELAELKKATEPVADMFEVRRPGAAIRPLVDRLKETPGRARAYLLKLRKSIPQQVLAYLKSFFPTANIGAIADGPAADCSEEKLQELMRQVEPVAAMVAERISLK